MPADTYKCSAAQQRWMMRLFLKVWHRQDHVSVSSKYFSTIFANGEAKMIKNFVHNQFAQNYADRGIVHLREIFTPGMLRVPKTQSELKELESVHKVSDTFDYHWWVLYKYVREVLYFCCSSIKASKYLIIGKFCSSDMVYEADSFLFAMGQKRFVVTTDWVLIDFLDQEHVAMSQ